MGENYYTHSESKNHVYNVHVDENGNAECCAEPSNLREKLEKLELEVNEILSLAYAINEFLFVSEPSGDCQEEGIPKRISFSEAFDQSRYKLGRARTILNEVYKKLGC